MTQKRTKSLLSYVNWGYILVLGVFQFMQYESDGFAATLLTYIPIAAQVSVLAYAFFQLKNHMYSLMDS